MKNTIDKRKTYLATLDTETCNGFRNAKGEMVDCLVYDLGLIIHDKNGNVYETLNLVINETFNGMKDLMKSCYYANKLPQYYQDIKNGERKVVSFYQARKMVLDLLKKYNAKIIIAHNAKFDYRALNNTIRYLTKSKYRYFFPRNIEIWDSQKMAHDTICQQKLYIKWCNENGYLTKHAIPRVKESAEILYRYISNNNDFVENHTGLKDCEIEKEITCLCLRQHKPMRKLAFGC